MTRRAALLGVLLAVFAGAVVVAGRVPGGGHAVAPPAAVERLGPEPGEDVGAYLARAAASLPAPDAGEVEALVQLTEQRAAAGAVDLAGGVRVSRVVLRVPLPRVQTALVELPVAGQDLPADLAGAAERAAAERAAAASSAPAGSRAARVAAAEAGALRAGCPCVLALLVRADGAALAAVAARPGVRAVHAAPPGTPLGAVAVAPLLPEQVDVAGPVPDDGPVP